MGSNFLRFALRSYKDIQILNFDKLTYAGNPENLRDFEDDLRYKFVQGDITVKDQVDQYIREFRPDIIVNFAAETHVDRSIMDPAAFLKTDVFGTHNLLEAARKYNIRMVQVSTDEVYGAVKIGEAAEDAPYVPRSPYSASKASADHLCYAYFVTYGTPVVITHSCNFYGPYQYPEKLIPLFITNLLEDKKVPVYGDGQQIREWIFTEDYCRALDVIAQKGTPGAIYNIGTGYRVPNLEVVRKILSALGKDEAQIEYVKDRPGHDRRYAVSHEKLRQEFGWEPKVSFDEGIAKTVQWYKNNKTWWGPLKSGDFSAYYKSWYTDQLKVNQNT